MKRSNVRLLGLAVPDGTTATEQPSPGHTKHSATAPDHAADRPPPSAAGSIEAMPRDDILQYIAEMCDALAYMARAQQCNTLAELLHEASAETSRQRRTG